MDNKNKPYSIFEIPFHIYSISNTQFKNDAVKPLCEKLVEYIRREDFDKAFVVISCMQDLIGSASELNEIAAYAHLNSIKYALLNHVFKGEFKNGMYQY